MPNPATPLLAIIPGTPGPSSPGRTQGRFTTHRAELRETGLETRVCSSAPGTCVWKAPGPQPRGAPVLNFRKIVLSAFPAPAASSAVKGPSKNKAAPASRSHSSATSNRSVGGIWPEGGQGQTQASGVREENHLTSLNKAASRYFPGCWRQEKCPQET